MAEKIREEGDNKGKKKKNGQLKFNCPFLCLLTTQYYEPLKTN